MNRELYIKNLNMIRYELSKSMLLESQDNRKALETVISKSNNDIKVIKDIEDKTISYIGESKFKEAVNYGYKKVQGKINNIKNSIKNLAKKENESSIITGIETVSEMVFDASKFLISAIYEYVIGIPIEYTQEFTLDNVLLFCCVGVANTIWFRILLLFLPGADLFNGMDSKSKVFRRLGACVIAPLNEEAAKSIALRISAKTGYKYSLSFGLLESVHYVIMQFRAYGWKIFLLRLIPLVMHLTTTLAQHIVIRISNNELKSFGFIIGCILHAVYNYYAIISGERAYEEEMRKRHPNVFSSEGAV